MWIYNDVELTEIPVKAVGFVYEITNQTTNRRYIGKKLFHSSKTVQREKKKKRIKVESNWKQYTGSNDELNQDIKNNNIIEKKILRICYSKSECNYIEALYQFQSNAVLSPLFYNKWVSVKSNHNQLKSLDFLSIIPYNNI